MIHSKLKQFFFVFWALFCLVHWTACTEDKIEPVVFGSLKGVVLDDNTGQPVAGMLASTNPASSTFLTDLDGTFFFDNLPAGKATVRVEKTNYESAFEAVTILENDTVSVILRVVIDTSNTLPPLVPTYINPSNGVSNVSVPTAFRWNKSATKGAFYTLLAFQNGQIVADTLLRNSSDTAFAASGLALGSDYFWQVITTDAQSRVSFGPVWQFKTAPPSDNRIVFARKENGSYSIWSADTDGKNLRRLTPANYAAWRPRWNPQRTRIAFLSTKSSINTHLFTMKPDGSDVQQVTLSVPVAGFSTLDLDFSWSPSGAELLYMNQNRLYRINADGSGNVQFALAPIIGFTFSEVDWNASNNRILVRLTGQNIYESVFIEYSSLGALLATVRDDAPGREGGPQYAILGNHFLLTKDITGSNNNQGRQLDARILLRNISSGVEVNLSMDKVAGTNDLDPRYSPTGAKIIFTNAPNDDQGPNDLYIMDVNGANRILYLENAEMADWH